MTRAALCLLFATFAWGCTSRALDTPGRDLSSFDLTGLDMLPDFTTLPDLAGVDLAGDMARPHYCDGIYVVDVSGVLLFFDPVKLTFTNVAGLQCPSFSTPYSMALQRDGTAYVVFKDGTLFSVDSTTGACAHTSFVPRQGGFSATFGMGFASNSPGSNDETLFVDTSELASIDTNTFVLSQIAPLVDGQQAEMTGTGAGELWGFFRAAVPHVARIDKTTGARSPDIAFPQIGDTTLDGYAFGFYGGLFYAFLYNENMSTAVWRIDTTKQTAELVLSNTGYQIVGSGVSTCAPTQ